MKAIKNMTEEERKDLLHDLMLPTPVLLDYLIESHRSAIANSIPDQVTTFWQRIMDQLIVIRKEYRS